MTAIFQPAASGPTIAPALAELAGTGLYYGGAFHAAIAGGTFETVDPATGERLASVSEGGAPDADAAVAAARAAVPAWRATEPAARAALLRRIATIIREHRDELAMLDAIDGGNPVSRMGADVMSAAEKFDFFAGLITEMKGESIPVGPGRVNFTLREPRGVIVRIVAFNHPFMFTASRMAAPLAAGNVVIIKPPEQAPLSSIRLAQLIGDFVPPGVFGILTGGRALGEALVSHPDVAMVGLVGSVPTGKAVMRAAADTLKPVLLELGGKNALIAYPDADPGEVADAIIGGMNFTWCGQSCGSTSRAFLHADIHDAVLQKVQERIGRFRPGLPTDPATSMGALIDRRHYDSVLDFVASGVAEGARLVCGGKAPDAPELAKGCFLEPTVFADVTMDMRIARQEIFGPVLSVLRWSDETRMMEEVNAVPYGLTCSIWTRDLERAHRAASAVEAGYVWVNEVSKHFLGAPFGGYKQSGIGREECLGELLAFTQEKNVHIRFSNNL